MFFAANHAAIKQRKAGDGHHDDQHGVATIIHAVSPLFGTGQGPLPVQRGLPPAAAGAVAVSAAFASSAKAGTDSATVPHKARSIRIFLIMTFSL
jgi:hypothetical protein